MDSLDNIHFSNLTFTDKDTLKKFVVILLMTILFASCEKESSGIIDIKFSNPPIVKYVKIEPERINLDTLLIGPEINPEDTLKIKLKVVATVFDKEGQDDINKTICQILNSRRGITLTTTELKKINDSTFRAEPEFKVRRKETGVYYVKVFSVDKSGFSSNEVYLSLELYRGNRPPTISDLIAPDTVFLQAQTVLIRMTLKATDPDGNEDIKIVQFNSYKPDGSPSIGNPFRMYDDGNSSGISGDDKAGDGIYSIVIQLPPTTQKGRYRFEFQAFDRSGASSNIITHFVTVL